MTNYVVGYLTFFENELRLFKVQAETGYEAIKQAMLSTCSSEEGRQQELDWQNSEEYPENYEDLIDMLYNSDIAINVIEI